MKQIKVFNIVVKPDKFTEKQFYNKTTFQGEKGALSGCDV